MGRFLVGRKALLKFFAAVFAGDRYALLCGKFFGMLGAILQVAVNAAKEPVLFTRVHLVFFAALLTGVAHVSPYAVIASPFVVAGARAKSLLSFRQGFTALFAMHGVFPFVVALPV